MARVQKSRGAPRYKLTGQERLYFSSELQAVREVRRKVGYKDRPQLSAEDPEKKARKGIFGSVAPAPPKKRKYNKKKPQKVQKNKLLAYFGKT